MFKRILVLVAGVALGVALTTGARRAAAVWNFWPNRELGKASGHVREVMQLVSENYVDPKAATHDALAKAALHGMVESLDPHSEFLEPKDLAALEEELSGDFSGIGVELELHRGRAAVVTPMAGSPSERAGLRRGDELVSVDGRALEPGLPIEAVIDRLRGKAGARLTLGAHRPATGKTLEFSLVREVIKLDSVRDVRVLPGGVGYLQLTEFSDHTGEEFRRALDTLLRDGATSLVLDLRGNPGGLLEAAVEVCEPFFRKGELIVSTRGRKPADREDYKAEADGAPLAVPVALLVNAGTASAAEVVTGALKDTGRAVVVGERTFGKGSVQAIFRLKEGEGVRLTTARYYTPGGATIHGLGIAPHVEVVLSEEEDEELRVQRARRDVTEPAEFRERFGFDPIEDKQLQAALDVLKGLDRLGARREPSGGTR